MRKYKVMVMHSTLVGKVRCTNNSDKLHGVKVIIEKANSHSASKEIPRRLWNLYVH
jgi:hypothetical protein